MTSNCYRCGEEREVAGHICQPCLDEVRAEEDGMRQLTPRQALNAMLDGAVLFTPNGYEVKWNKAEQGFVFVFNNAPLARFDHLRMKVE